FSTLQPHIHYSAKANASLAVLKALIDAGAGIDAVSAGEIHKALAAGASPQNIVFAGVGKTRDELLYALQAGVGWFNVENVGECVMLDQLAAELNHPPVRVALRLNPQVTADTHPYIATGHGGAKFGLTADTVARVLAHQDEYPRLDFAGIHLHIGSQLHDTAATAQAVKAALELIKPYPQIRTVNIGGGLPVAYHADERAPEFSAFASTLEPLLKDYTVLLEPGRSIIADAGILVTTITYVKQQAGQVFYITDASMAELIRPALYQAQHAIIPLDNPQDTNVSTQPVQVVGPVCETADVLGRDVLLPQMQPGDNLALLTAGAYGMVMASNYNARLRPPEVVIEPDGVSWRVTRQRETWDNLLQLETI
ncbi:MAG: diaminopimelate decarboxylase, partial [Anaerolineae bacterium]|nr:diaminopimelate decarboxylase [Anaerolineae bacterium]